MIRRHKQNKTNERTNEQTNKQINKQTKTTGGGEGKIMKNMEGGGGFVG